MSRIRRVAHASWSGDGTRLDSGHTDDAGHPHTLTLALERGEVLFFPALRFDVERREADIFSPTILSAGKNISFDPASQKVSGTTLAGPDRDCLRGVVARFSGSAQALVDAVFPSYRGRLQRARASFRPAEIAGRQTSWRQDDTRLHIDSFPSTPVHGRRILRVFSNVNPSGRPRTWRVGPDFSVVAERFAPGLSVPFPGSALLRRLVRATKTRRSPYDALMLQLHDRMKADAVFQQTCEQEPIEFPPGSTWVAFTDAVSHAAHSGQYQLEQTFLLPVDAMEDEQRSPLRILERLKDRRLV